MLSLMNTSYKNTSLLLGASVARNTSIKEIHVKVTLFAQDVD